MSPIQQMLLGVGAVATKTYVDDIFSTFLYKGNKPSTQSINNGIDLSTEGGLVWLKSRTNTYNHILQDTVNGTGKFMKSNSYEGATNTSQYITSFNTNGFSLGTDNDINNSSQDFSSWSFRKAPGFFDIVSWTGNDNGSRQISHNLGCQPGLIILKNSSRNGTNWMVWHRDFSATQFLELNATSAASTDSTLFGGSGSAKPTSTNFTIGGGESANKNGDDFTAYLFAGGESTTATASSVVFGGDSSGSKSYQKIASPGTWADFGTSDFTFESWVKPDGLDDSGGNYKRVFSLGGSSSSCINLRVNDDNSAHFTHNGSVKVNSATGAVPLGQWTHIAIARESNTLRLFINGILVDTDTSFTSSVDYSASGAGNALWIGNLTDISSGSWDGSISNFRIVKGTAVYTSSFKPPTEPLTNITNTILLTCNDATNKNASTIQPATKISYGGGEAAQANSPFDDPAAHVFGESGSESVIKCGSYVGNGSNDGPDVFLGHEPQWLMVKRIDSADEWPIYDSMRGIVTGGNDFRLYANQNAAEYSTNANYFALTPTGFKVSKASGEVNASGGTYIYLCIRRADGYVGKPPELGTGVFAMDTGDGSNTIPAFDSGFPVDFGIKKAPASSGDWIATTRLTGLKYVKTNTDAAEGTSTTFVYDSNVGYAKSQDSTDQGWMWKRHAGFDVVAYDSPGGSNTHIRHSLSKVPEMMWVKKRDATGSWFVYHKGLNSGSNPHDKYLVLNSDAAEASDSGYLWYAAPTSTSFILGSSDNVNSGANEYLALLFASVDGISKVGSYTGTGNAVSVTTGFQPRFYIIKRSDAGSSPWYVVDSLRGMSNSGDEKGLQLENSQAQFDYNFGTTSSTGFTITATHASLNTNGGKYIYYCHA